MRHCLVAESRHSVADVTLSHIIGELHLVYQQELVYCLKFQRMHYSAKFGLIRELQYLMQAKG